MDTLPAVVASLLGSAAVAIATYALVLLLVAFILIPY
jgi:hypothetical protein